MSDQFPAVEGERFAAIPDHPGYVACSDGSIYSNRRGGWKRLSPLVDKYGYMTVGPCDKTGQHTRTVHRLIASAFHGPCPAGMQCRHIDGNKTNNRPDNLAWGTALENSRDKACHGTIRGPVGSRNHFSKLGASNKEIASRFPIRERNLRLIRANKTWVRVTADLGHDKTRIDQHAD